MWLNLRIYISPFFCFQGLVVALVQFVEDFIDEKNHSHCCEAEICKNDDVDADADVDDDVDAKADDGVDAANPDNSVNAANDDDDDDLSRLLSNIGQARRASSNRDAPQPSIFDIDEDDDVGGGGGGVGCGGTRAWSAAKRLKVSIDKSPKAVEAENVEGSSSEATSAMSEVPPTASVADAGDDVVAVAMVVDADDEFREEQLDLPITPAAEISIERRRELKQFRVNSPSYQAVQVSCCVCYNQ